MKVAEDTGEPVSARDAPAIVEEQQGQVNRSIQVNAAMMHGAMGVVWLAGFGITYLAFGHGRPGAVVPAWIAVAVIVVANAVAVMARGPGSFAVLALACWAGFAVATRRYARIREPARE